MGARSCESHMHGCVHVHVVTYGACTGEAVCDADHLSICMWLVCVYMCICVREDECVCVRLIV